MQAFATLTIIYNRDKLLCLKEPKVYFVWLYLIICGKQW